MFEPVQNKMLFVVSHFSIRHWNPCNICIFILYGFETLDNDCSYKIKTYLEFSISFYFALWCKFDECKSRECPSVIFHITVHSQNWLYLPNLHWIILLIHLSRVTCMFNAESNPSCWNHAKPYKTSWMMIYLLREFI